MAQDTQAALLEAADSCVPRAGTRVRVKPFGTAVLAVDVARLQSRY